MKIVKAPVLLKKAVTMCKSKTGVLAARLLVLATFRRRMATVGVISHKIYSLMVADDQAKASLYSCRKLEKMSTVHGSEVIDLPHQLALFDQEENDASSCPDWRLHPIFNDDDDCCYTDEYEEELQEPSVMDVIRSNREVEVLELDDEVDQAAEMFIRRFREQMNKSF